jgi:hypothetical protein
VTCAVLRGDAGWASNARAIRVAFQELDFKEQEKSILDWLPRGFSIYELRFMNYESR